MIISRDSLMSLEVYSKKRPEFRQQVIEHKKLRTIHLGNHVTLLFEDEMTLRYQVQEMLRIEKTCEEDGILDELDAYNPLVPDGRNLKATMLIEYADPVVRARELQRLKGIERASWMQVQGFDKVFAIADEDLQRENETKTSSVHFMRFEFTDAMVDALRGGASFSLGVDHDYYGHLVTVIEGDSRTALMADFA